MNVYRMLTYEYLRTFVAPWVALYLRTTCEGRGNVPAEGGCLFVSNRRSMWDPFLIMNEVDRFVYFLTGSRSSVIPVVRTVARMLENVRTKEGYSLEGKSAGLTEWAVGRLKDGEALCVFPESVGPAVRPSRGSGITYFRTDFALMALKAGVPVVPVAIITSGGRKGGRFLASRAEVLRAIEDKGIEITRVVPDGRVHIRIGVPVHLGGFLDEPPTRRAVEAISGKVRKIILKLYSGTDLERFLTGERPFDIYTDRV